MLRQRHHIVPQRCGIKDQSQTSRRNATEVKQSLQTRHVSGTNPTLDGKFTRAKHVIIAFCSIQISSSGEVNRLAASQFCLLDNNRLSNTTLVCQAGVGDVFTNLEGASNRSRVEPLQTRVDANCGEGCVGSNTLDDVVSGKQTSGLVIVTKLGGPDRLTINECAIGDSRQSVDIGEITSFDCSCCDIDQTVNVCLDVCTVADMLVVTRGVVLIVLLCPCATV